MEFLPDTWYSVELDGLGAGSLGVTLSVNGIMVTLTNEAFPGIDFSIFSGALYIGGHPSLSTLQVRSALILTMRPDNFFP